MKCPYKTPLEAYYFKKLAEMWVVKNSEGKIIFWDVTEEEAGYIVEAINSHEKFETALRIIANVDANRAPNKRGDSGWHGRWCNSHIAEQALKKGEPK